MLTRREHWGVSRVAWWLSGLTREGCELDSASTEFAGDLCSPVSPVGSKFFQAVWAFCKEADDPSFGVIGFEQEAAVAEFAFDVCSGVLAGHSKFLSAVWALQQESLGFDRQEAIV